MNVQILKFKQRDIWALFEGQQREIPDDSILGILVKCLVPPQLDL